MKKLNNNGFAITGVVYSFLLLFIVLITSSLLLLVNRKLLIDKIRDDIFDKYSQKPWADPVITIPWKKIVATIGTTVTNEICLSDVTAIDDEGTPLTNITCEFPPSFSTSTPGTYTLTYKVTDKNNASSTKTAPIEVTATHSYQRFEYTGSLQSYEAKIGPYKVEVWGAQGGNSSISGQKGATGAYAASYVTVTSNETWKILVGGQGVTNTYSNRGGGGGGGTFVTTNSNVPIAVAGGGGGGGDYVITSYPASYGQATNNGGNGASGGAGGSGGNGGAGSSYTSGGAGLTGNGNSATNQGGAVNPYAFINGGAGGVKPTSWSDSSSGGYGGGGWAYAGGGAGGGYSGGGGGGWANAYPGGGGGSYYTGVGGTAIAGNASMPNPLDGANMTGNTGNGYARITPLIIFEY